MGLVGTAHLIRLRRRRDREYGSPRARKIAPRREIGPHTLPRPSSLDTGRDSEMIIKERCAKMKNGLQISLDFSRRSCNDAGASSWREGRPRRPLSLMPARRRRSRLAEGRFKRRTLKWWRPLDDAFEPRLNDGENPRSSRVAADQTWFKLNPCERPYSCQRSSSPIAFSRR